MALHPEATTVPLGGETTQIGNYRLIKPLGHGGMGTVYLAERTDLMGKQVAIKLIRQDVHDPEVIKRFEREREILATLDHPNIARFLDAGVTSTGLPYLVMEYVEGEPIDSYCDRRQMSVEGRLDLFEDLCGAVQYLHEHRIVHRDLKPSNVLVTSEGALKLLDFGIAKLLASPADYQPHLTRSGLRLMTPEYASPEQVKGEAVTPLSDIYALGIILYEMLSGHRPYRLRSRIFHEVVRAICDEPAPPPSTAVTWTEGSGATEVTPEQVSRSRKTSPDELRRRLRGDLDAILLKTLDKEPRQRYWSAHAIADDIRAHRENKPIVAPREGGRLVVFSKLLKRRAPLAIGLLVVIVLLATGGITVNRTGALILGGVALAAVLWTAATDPIIGRKIADFTGSPKLSYVVLPALVLVILLIALAPTENLGVTVVIGISAVLLSRFGVALIRRRGLGPPIRLLRWRMQTFTFMSQGLSLLMSVCIVWRATGVEETSIRLTFAACSLSLATAFVLLAVFDGLCEIRKRGIVFGGSVFKWEDIENIAWEPATGQYATKFTMLRLDVRRTRLRFLEPPRMLVPHQVKNELDALIRMYLSPWPQAEKRNYNIP